MIIYPYKFGLSAFAVLTGLTIVACHTPTLEESYAGPWRDPTGDVAVALAHNGATGCGEFYQKESRTSKGEYAVACNASTSDQGPAAWVVYLVWPNIDKIVGPDYAAIRRVGGPPRKG